MSMAKDVKKSIGAKFNGKKFQNISSEQQSGLEKLQRRRAEEGLVFFQTDKSGKLSVDQVNNFSNKMKTHVYGNIEVQIQDVIRIDNELNARSKCWVEFSKFVHDGVSRIGFNRR